MTVGSRSAVPDDIRADIARSLPRSAPRHVGTYGPWQSSRATSSRPLGDQIERLGPTSATYLHLAARVQKLAMLRTAAAPSQELPIWVASMDNLEPPT
jgi:hypothetical protein